MSESQQTAYIRSVYRALGLGLVVFLLLLLVAAFFWWLGSAVLGMETGPAFLLAALVSPLLVIGLLAWGFFSRPLAQRQRWLGVRAKTEVATTAPPTDESATPPGD